MKYPLVSIIMNCYNSDKYLYDSINSIFSQTYNNWELIFWDNQSTDQSSNIVKSFKDDRIKYFYADHHTKLGMARNKAITNAKGDYIAFLDCDDIWFPEKLEKQLPLFKNQTIGVVICDTYFFNDRKIIKQLYKNKKPPSNDFFKRGIKNYFISLETVIIRKQALLSLDIIFDPNYQVIEEFDTIMRILYFWDLGYVDEVLAKWRVHENSWTWKYPELFPIELENFINKMHILIHNFSVTYKSELDFLNYKIAIQKSIIEWRKGYPSTLRKILTPYLFKKKEALILFFWSFLPFKIFDFIYKLQRGL